MHIDQIELGHSYYGYDCDAAGKLRLLQYQITSKSRWACRATLYQVQEYGNREIGIWSGYPDNLYKTTQDAIEGLQANAKKLSDEFKKKAQAMVNGVSVMACCDTCAKLEPEAMFCKVHKTYICFPSREICKDGAYCCDPGAITAEVLRKQRQVS